MDIVLKRVVALSIGFSRDVQAREVSTCDKMRTLRGRMVSTHEILLGSGVILS